MVNAALKGDFETASKLHYQLLPLIHAAFIETNPIPIKAAMDMCGMPAGKTRLPLCPMKKENEEKVKKVLEEMDLI
jgi:4-hydroxy-tetrahydrodipicolinate synthase